MKKNNLLLEFFRPETLLFKKNLFLKVKESRPFTLNGYEYPFIRKFDSFLLKEENKTNYNHSIENLINSSFEDFAVIIDLTSEILDIHVTTKGYAKWYKEEYYDEKYKFGK